MLHSRPNVQFSLFVPSIIDPNCMQSTLISSKASQADYKASQMYFTLLPVMRHSVRCGVKRRVCVFSGECKCMLICTQPTISGMKTHFAGIPTGKFPLLSPTQTLGGGHPTSLQERLRRIFFYHFQSSTCSGRARAASLCFD